MTRPRTEAEVDARMEAWHKSAPGDDAVSDALGWTWQEFAAWVETGELPADCREEEGGVSERRLLLCFTCPVCRSEGILAIPVADDTPGPCGHWYVSSARQGEIVVPPMSRREYELEESERDAALAKLGEMVLQRERDEQRPRDPERPADQDVPDPTEPGPR